MTPTNSANGYHSEMSAPPTWRHDPAATIARLIAGEQLPIDHLSGLWLTIAQAVRAAPAGTDPLEALYAAGGDTEDGRSIIRTVLNPKWVPLHPWQPSAPQSESTPARRIALPRIWSHGELMAHRFPPRRWILDGLIPDSSLTLLGGRKKHGKSWLCLQLAQGVALGFHVLDRATTLGTVLYLCLEDGDWRTQERLFRQHAARQIPGLHYSFGPLRPLDDGGISQVEAMLSQLEPALLIIDTLAAAKSRGVDENSASDMAPILNRMRELAQTARCAILVTAHHGKRTGGDAGDDLRGSSALAGAADLNLGLYKTESGGNCYLLKAEGRDIPDTEIPIVFDPVHTFAWHVQQAIAHSNQEARVHADQELLDALTRHGPCDATTVAAAIGRDRARTSSRLVRLAREGAISRSSEKSARGPSRVLYAITTSI